MIQFLDIKAVNARFKDEFFTAFSDVLDKGWYVLGDYVNSFEKEYGAYTGCRHCIGVANGLDALFISLKVLGIGKGDEVILPSNTYIASWLAVTMTGATPVPVEPRIETFNINPESIAEKITANTKAVMPVHLYGQSCEMDAILKITKAQNIYVVEDNAQSQGAKYNGTTTGSFGIMNGTSFYPGKNLGALGDGGAITTNCDELARQASVYRNYGSSKKYYNEVHGINSRLDELQAAFLLIKLKRLEEDNSARRKIADLYHQHLKDVGDIQLPSVANGAEPVYHLYVIRTSERDALAEHLKKQNIGTMVHYPVPPHLQKAYQEMNFKKGDFPIAEKIADTCLSLPMWPGMSQIQIETVTHQIKSFYHG